MTFFTYLIVHISLGLVIGFIACRSLIDRDKQTQPDAMFSGFWTMAGSVLAWPVFFLIVVAYVAIYCGRGKKVSDVDVR